MKTNAVKVGINKTRFLLGIKMKLKLKLYVIILKMIIRDKEKLFLTGKQKSQIENFILKIEKLIET